MFHITLCCANNHHTLVDFLRQISPQPLQHGVPEDPVPHSKAPSSGGVQRWQQCGGLPAGGSRWVILKEFWWFFKLLVFPISEFIYHGLWSLGEKAIKKLTLQNISSGSLDVSFTRNDEWTDSHRDAILVLYSCFFCSWSCKNTEWQGHPLICVFYYFCFSGTV